MSEKITAEKISLLRYTYELFAFQLFVFFSLYENQNIQHCNFMCMPLK